MAGETYYIIKDGIIHFINIFYAGNTAVGRCVTEAAPRILTPVLSEMKGKSPNITDKEANLDYAIKRITS